MPGGASTGGIFEATRDYSPTGQWSGLNLNPVGTFVVPILSGFGATTTLTAAQSGAMVLFDRAAGEIFTLPPPAKGLNFTFVVTTSVTSNNHTVVTDAATTLLIGSVWLTVAAGTGTEFFPNGSSNVKIQMNGTTTGGLINTVITFYCVSTTQWVIDGTVAGSGTIATPFV